MQQDQSLLCDLETLYPAMGDRVSNLNHDIITSMAEAIIRHDPIEEIQDMIIDCTSYRKILQAWVDPRTNLNLLQVAVAVRYTAAVKILCSNKLKAIFAASIWDDRPEVENPPLHLACKKGALNIIQYFVEEHHCDLTSKGIVTYGCQGTVTYVTDEDISDDPNEVEEEVGVAASSSTEQRSAGELQPAPEESPTYLKAQTPYEICVEGGHLDCANFLCKWIIRNMDKPLHPVADSSLLHQAVYLGSAEHVRLLLENQYDLHINVKDSVGHMPVHVASLTGEADCLEAMLEFGANLNARADHRTCLHIMYWSKFRPEKFVACTQTLIDYGVNVNAMDHNNNTALDYLAWELGQKWYQISKAWITMHRVSEVYRYSYTNATYNKPVMNDDQFRQEIFKCMELLLQAGASTLVRNRDGTVDHTIVHTLLQNTGWPLNCSLRQRPLDVYKALTLLFDYGADPNVIAKNNNESAMTMLLMHSLHEVPGDLKAKFVALFIMNSADLECLIPEPKQYKENYSDRRWNIYPVMVALQERHPMNVVAMLYSFMSLPHVYRSLRMTEEKFLWHRMTWTLGGSMMKDDKYWEQWLAIRLPSVRSLKHCCKLLLLRRLYRKGHLTEYLPLPRALINYLQDYQC